jgi:glycosyltransferase involved in cell wall biosynthesis
MPSNLAQGIRVAVVAENASFKFGGEASLPLHYFSRLRARGMDAWLIVHGRTKPELELLFPDEQDRILYIPDRWFHKLIWKMSRPLPRRVSEATFGTLMVLINQWIQRAMVKKLVGEHGVNLVHQPIPVSPKAPSFLSGLGVPVIIGPMNGGMDYPAAFRTSESLFTRITVAVGRASANGINQIVPGKKNAKILLVANPRTRQALPSCVQGEVVEIPENGVDLCLWTLPFEYPAPSQLESKDQRNYRDQIKSTAPRFLFVGRLVDWKRLDFVLHALVRLPDAQLEVIGDGAMRATWTELAEQLGIAQRVQFIGWLPQPDCVDHLHRATALVLPSIYECGGAVVLEAMATGIPAIATNWGGPAEYIDESCGILVDPTSAETIVDGFTVAMQKLAGDPELRVRLGQAGREKVEKLYDWNRKIDHILEIYRQAVDTVRS